MARNSRKSKMAMGSVEYGDIYSRLCETSDEGNRVPVLRDGKFVRDQRIGRLVVDFGNDAFWFRPLRGTAWRTIIRARVFTRSSQMADRIEAA